MPDVVRVPLVVVAGLARDAAGDVADALVDPRTLVLQYDLTQLAAGHQQWRHWPDPFGAFHSDPCLPVRACRDR